MSDLAQLLREKRKAEGIGVRAVAQATGLSFSTVARLERGLPATPATQAKIRAWLAGPSPVNVLEQRVATLERQVASLLNVLLQSMEGE